MENTKKIKATIETLLQKIEEPELIKSLGNINSQLDEVDKEYDDLIQKHKDLKLDYADYIKKQAFKTPSDEENENTEETPSFEEFAAKIISEKGEEF